MTMPRAVDVDIKLIKNLQKPGHVDFNPDSITRTANTKNGRHKFEFKNRWHPGFCVRFNIVDDGDLGYRFPSDPADAIWVCPIQSEDDPCPSAKCDWPGFVPVTVEPNQNGEADRTLVVRNENKASALFAFTLKMIRDTGPDKLVLYDPIGNNQNGPDIIEPRSLVMPLVGLAVVAAALFAAFQFFVDKPAIR